MLLLYNILSSVILFFYLPLLLLKKGPEDKSAFIRERLGISNYAHTDIWVHAVSVGETIACMPFLKKLKKDFPGRKITFSTTTYTGQKIAKEKFPEADRIMYIPWDSGLCISRAIGSIRPKLFITIETEIWPLMISRLKRSGTKIILLNGRISPRSFNGYKRASFFMKKVLSDMDHLLMQSKGDAERILSIGADPGKAGVMGNFKFDLHFGDITAAGWINDINGRIFLAGSTHKGEDEIILDAFITLLDAFPDLKLVIAPRHPERFNDVEALINARGLSYIKRSDINSSSHTKLFSVILLDTVGELPIAFSRSAVTFIGGSLLPYGGHNILEPAYWSNPIIFGPHMENFPFHRDFLDSSAAILVMNSSDIVKNVTELLNNPDIAAAMGSRAKAIVDENTGAVEKAIELVRRYLGAA
ncbi:MAG: 3-deoxy-D-manno-octulosonic acid transferase [Thermodesulfovibrionia bacterium]|nr:3-deoxy-D-manno-octulosonic acid transferase [Thermodesulfovibrionia bacterium]